jgi:sugar/nucleoside kinase (ribokinase family)
VRRIAVAQPILLVGSVALDDVETPFGAVRAAIGGSATYFALAARFFAPVRLVAVVGTDFPPAYRQLLEASRVDTRGLEVAPGRCFRWGGRYGADLNQRETVFTELNVFETFHPKVPREFRDSPFVFLGNIHPELQAEVLRQVPAPRLVALDTMNLWIETARAALVAVLRSVHLLVLNDAEARDLAGESNLVRAGRRLLELGPRIVVVKKGEHGATMFTRDGTFSAAAVPLQDVLDPTGAGDSFAGGLVGYLAAAGDLSDAGLRRAIAYGSVLASFTVEAFGVERLRDVRPADIVQRFGQLRHLTHFDAGGSDPFAPP